MDFNLILEFFKNTFGDGSMANALIVVTLVIAMIAGAFAIRHFGLNEKISQLQKVWNMADGIISDAIVFVSTMTSDHADLLAAELEATRLATEGYIIDSRMLYVVQETQRLIKKTFGFEPDFVFIHRKAEHIFQKLKNSGKIEV